MKLETMPTLNRRDFMKSFIALTATALVGFKDDGIEIVECVIDDDKLRAAIHVGEMHLIDGQIIADVAFDVDAAYDAMTFIDSRGRRYSYREIERMVDV